MPKPDLLQDDSGHFVQGCVSLLSFRHPKLLNHDSVSKGITWGVQDSSAVSNPDKESPSSDRNTLVYVGYTHSYVEQSRGMESPLAELQHPLDRHLGAGTGGVRQWSCRVSFFKLTASTSPQWSQVLHYRHLL